MDSQKLPTGGSADNHEGHNDPSSSIDGLPPAYSAVVADNGHGENHAAASSNGGSSIPAAREKQAGGPEDEPPPAYTETYGRLDISEDGMGAQAEIAGDGRVNININQPTRGLTGLFPTIRSQWRLLERQKAPSSPQKPPGDDILEFAKNVPPMNILIQIIGSRGDVQPFIALGKILKEQHMHRVRVATHPVFKDFIEKHGLEFFSLGGDPSELMAFMVKNPGLVPGLESLKAGDVSKRRKGMWEVLLGCWRACIEPGDGMSDQPDVDSNGSQHAKPFVADAIIANPPSFGHIHCAERLGIPLHLMFTMPWSPTAAFPHPLANIQHSNVEHGLSNFLSYALVDMMTWQGLGDLVNKFRQRTLGLEPVSTMWAPGMISRLKVPHTYCWSPALIPKPVDWPSQINISGFFFLPLASSYTPSPELETFLAAGPPPVYIGFGSIVIDNPDVLANKIFQAVQMAGCRALVSKGWGGIGADGLAIPDNVHLLGNCPHDWLFPRCAAVVHHGGAGTTAAGISCGKPTVIVPFFGDQPFWGAMVHKSGAGPAPIPHEQLTAEGLAAAITVALNDETKIKAEELGACIKSESGACNGARSFHESLHGTLTRCNVFNDRVAVWNVRGTNIKLSALAARVLVEEGLVEGGYAGLKLWRSKEWAVDDGPMDPISGMAGALMGTFGSIMMGVGDFPKEVFKARTRDSEKGKGKGKGKETESREPQLSGQPSPETESEDSKGKTIAPQSTTSLESGVNDIGEKSTSQIEPQGTQTRGSTASGSTNGTKQVKPSKGKGKGCEGIGHDLHTALGASKGVKKIVGAGIRSPMEFSLGLAQGFRNVPRLYGDSTVRPAEKVTGFHSGLKVAGKEFSLGLYDGFTGLLTQPIKGAKEEGAVGVIKGFGKGFSGFVFKTGAGVWAIPGYTMKGIHREYMKFTNPNDATSIITAQRVAQGEVELEGEHREEIRAAVLGRWWIIKRNGVGGVKASSSSWIGEKRKLAQPLGDATTYDEDARQLDLENDDELERAIRASMVDTSTDTQLEEAIRLSLSASSAQSHDSGDLDDEMERAIRESLQEEMEKKKLAESDESEVIAPVVQASLAEEDARRNSGGSQSG